MTGSVRGGLPTTSHRVCSSLILRSVEDRDVSAREYEQTFVSDLRTHSYAPTVRARTLAMRFSRSATLRTL